MMNNETSLGLNPLVPEDAKRYEEQSHIVSTHFQQEGFLPIKTPTIELQTSLSPGLGPTLRKDSIQFFTPSGELAMLRPDHTTPIAQIVATQMTDASLPIKLYYCDPVFRKCDRESEIYQAGCEYIGEGSSTIDADVISLCIESLKALGYDGDDIGVDIGHISMTEGLSEEKRKALLEGDYLTFGSIPDRGDTSILDKESELSEVYDHLQAKGYGDTIKLNLGLVKGLYYYTGIIFEVYIKGHRNIVASGGRYDQLVKQFGKAYPAVGFAINLNALRGANT